MKGGTKSVEFLKYRISKGWQILPALAAKPTHIPWLFQGVSPGRLVALDVEWLLRANIRTVLDIGANTGQFASTVHHLLPEATIHSFEPLADCYVSMKERLANIGNFRAYKLAVGNEDSVVDFQRNEFSQSSSVLPMADLHKDAFTWSSKASTVQVEMKRLDTALQDIYLEPNVLVKIDVQGYEDRVLLGGEFTIKASHVVLVETSLEPLYEGQASFDQVYQIMTSYGFKYGGSMDQLLSPIDGRVLQADALFFRRAA
ncbi:MAG TPA: FkbM family methyltransferase [Dehalococcoidia bacterium]|nr:FkbM family methyltransferase [Dehalococcoidia bacterium]